MLCVTFTAFTLKLFQPVPLPLDVGAVGRHPAAHGGPERSHGGGQSAAQQVHQPATREGQTRQDRVAAGGGQRTYQHGLPPARSGSRD